MNARALALLVYLGVVHQFMTNHPSASLSDALYETSDAPQLRTWNDAIRTLIAAGLLTREEMYP